MYQGGFSHKTIRTILRNKLKQLEASLPENLRELFRKNALITGGAINSMLVGDKVNDFDIYLKTQEAARLIAEHYVTVFNKNKQVAGGIKYQPAVKLDVRRNIKGVDEPRIVIFMKSAGISGEKQEDYSYFEYSQNGGQDFVESVFNSDDPVEQVEETAEVIRESKKKRAEFKPLFLTDNA